MTRPIPRRIRSRHRAALGSGLAVCGWLMGCAPEEDFPLPPVVWEGESVRVRMDDPGIQVCGGTFEGLDRHAALVRDALLLEGDGVVEYSIGDEDFVDAACEGALVEPRACATVPAGRVFTREPFLPHELVHAVRRLDPQVGHLRGVYEEGLATLFGADDLSQATVPLEVLELFDDPLVVEREEYFRAGQTMAILLDDHGAEAFRDFDIASRRVSEDAAFTEAFGETKEDFSAFAESVPHCEQSQWWVPLLECDGEPLTADPQTGALTLTGDLSCGDPDVNGPAYDRMWTSRHFRLDEPTSRLGYSFDFPEDATLEIVGCNPGCPERFAYLGTRYQVNSYGNGLPGLEPGEYFMRLTRPVSDGSGHFEIIFE